MVSLRDARRDRGWSQTTAVARLRELAEQGEVDVASAASLKTQLSRWENGTVPDEPYRTLLAELYERELGELGIDVTPHWERTHEIPGLLTEIRDELRALNELLRGAPRRADAALGRGVRPPASGRTSAGAARPASRTVRASTSPSAATETVPTAATASAVRSRTSARGRSGASNMFT